MRNGLSDAEHIVVAINDALATAPAQDPHYCGPVGLAIRPDGSGYLFDCNNGGAVASWSSDEDPLPVIISWLGSKMAKGGRDDIYF